MGYGAEGGRCWSPGGSLRLHSRIVGSDRNIYIYADFVNLNFKIPEAYVAAPTPPGLLSDLKYRAQYSCPQLEEQRTTRPSSSSFFLLCSYSILALFLPSTCFFFHYLPGPLLGFCPGTERLLARPSPSARPALGLPLPSLGSEPLPCAWASALLGPQPPAWER